MYFKENNKNFQYSIFNEVERIVDDVLENNEKLTADTCKNSFKQIKKLIASNLLSKLSDSKNYMATRQMSNKSLNSKSINSHKYHEISYKNELYQSVNESNSISGDDDDDENKSSQYLSEPKHFKSKTRRSLPVPCPRRLSGFACSTTTSATGLPIDLPPARQRSLSLKCCSNNCKPKSNILFYKFSIKSFV